MSYGLESNFVQAVILRLGGHYDLWSMLMENFLWSKEYWPIVADVIDAVKLWQMLKRQSSKLENWKIWR